MNTEWLNEICDPNSLRSIVQQPYSVDVDGQQWAFSTNGCTLYAIKINNNYPAMTQKDQRERGITNWLKTQKETLTTTVKALREWAGADTLKYCQECDEDGFEDFETLCTHCNGDGYIEGFETRHGLIEGVFVNRFLIAKPFHHFTDGLVHVVTTTSIGMVHFIGEGWHVIVMPMRFDGRSDEDKPVVFTAWENAT